MIIVPSRIMKAISSFASSLLKPFAKSATRKQERVRMRTVASDIAVCRQETYLGRIERFG
jgi:hypothetical protein